MCLRVVDRSAPTGMTDRYLERTMKVPHLLVAVGLGTVSALAPVAPAQAAPTVTVMSAPNSVPSQGVVAVV